MDIKEDKGNPYISPNNFKFKRNNQMRKQRNNHSLPSINGPLKDDKVNTIRNQIDETKNEIVILKARINALKWQKKRNQKRRQKANSQINFINTVRDRLYQDKKYKQQIQQRKEKQLQYLKQQANTMRVQLIKNKQLSMSLANQKKQQDAEQQRKQRKQEQENIKRLKSIELTENQLKAKSVKKNQLQIQQKMKIFNQSRFAFARQNHHNKVERSLSEREKAQKALRKLKKQQQKMLQQCKQSEAHMLSSLYELQSLNPEKKRRGSVSSRVTTIKQN